MVGTCDREAAKITSKPPGLTHHLHRYLYIRTSYIAICNDLDAGIRMPMHAIEAVGPPRRNSSHQKCQRIIHRDLYLNPGISHAHELDPDGVAAPAAHPLAAQTRSRRAPTPEPRSPTPPLALLRTPFLPSSKCAHRPERSEPDMAGAPAAPASDAVITVSLLMRWGSHGNYRNGADHLPLPV